MHAHVFPPPLRSHRTLTNTHRAALRRSPPALSHTSTVSYNLQVHTRTGPCVCRSTPCPVSSNLPPCPGTVHTPARSLLICRRSKVLQLEGLRARRRAWPAVGETAILLTLSLSIPIAHTHYRERAVQQNDSLANGHARLDGGGLATLMARGAAGPSAGPGGASRRRDFCHSAAPTSNFSRRINSDEERASAKWKWCQQNGSGIRP